MNIDNVSVIERKINKTMGVLKTIGSFWVNVSRILERKNNKFLVSALQSIIKNNPKYLSEFDNSLYRFLYADYESRSILYKSFVDTILFLCYFNEVCYKKIRDIDYYTHIERAVEFTMSMDRTTRSNILLLDRYFYVFNEGFAGIILNYSIGESAHWPSGYFYHISLFNENNGWFFMRISPLISISKIESRKYISNTSYAPMVFFKNVKVYPFLRRIKALNNFGIVTESIRTLDLRVLKVPNCVIKRVSKGEFPHILGMFIVESLGLLSSNESRSYIVGVPTYIEGKINNVTRMSINNDTVMLYELDGVKGERFYILSKEIYRKVYYKGLGLVSPYMNINGKPVLIDYRFDLNLEVERNIQKGNSEFINFFSRVITSCNGVPLDLIKELLKKRLDRSSMSRVPNFKPQGIASYTSGRSTGSISYICRLCGLQVNSFETLLNHILNNHADNFLPFIRHPIVRITREYKRKRSINVDELLKDLKNLSHVRYCLNSDNPCRVFYLKLFSCLNKLKESVGSTIDFVQFENCVLSAIYDIIIVL